MGTSQLVQLSSEYRKLSSKFVVKTVYSVAEITLDLKPDTKALYSGLMYSCQVVFTNVLHTSFFRYQNNKLLFPVTYGLNLKQLLVMFFLLS